MDPILDAIDEALKRNGLSDAAASRMAVGHPSLIKNLRLPREGEKRYNLPALKKLADVLGLEFYFGPPRDIGPVQQVVVDAEEYAKVPLHEVELAAGLGAVNGEEEISGELVFKRSWLRRVGVSPANARLARVRGKSMEPTLHEGDVVMIDMGRNTVPARPRDREKPLRADLYALREGDQLRIKRVEHSTMGRLVLHSDNAMMFPPEVREGYDAQQLGIIGKVVWWGHTERAMPESW